ncbi:hypothetical protein, partial [Undibacterium sp.]|uniref:hypothetical protein n=1 Tax=Undibacterium sp. TaxID=1914977 RepID=UPI00374D5BF2
GFDPFTLVHIGSGTTLTAVLNHKNLAENAQHNTVSARMRELLQQKAREKFAGEGTGGYRDGGELASAIALCAGSIPKDLMDELISRHVLAEH